MSFARGLLLAFCFPALLAGLLPGACTAQPANAPASAAGQPPTKAQPAGQAYSLPPDKLAKAIALSRIRNILEFAGALWGLAVLWLLLATRAAAGLEAWTQRICARRWLQGLLFFAAFLVITGLAGLPLDVYAHQVSRSYGISVQGWGSWLGDQGKALGLSVLMGAPALVFFNWIVRRWPRRYWLGAWVATLPLLVLSGFASPLLEPIFNKYEPLAEHHAIELRSGRGLHRDARLRTYKPAARAWRDGMQEAQQIRQLGRDYRVGRHAALRDSVMDERGQRGIAAELSQPLDDIGPHFAALAIATVAAAAAQLESLPPGIGPR